MIEPSRAYTVEEMRGRFLGHMYQNMLYWLNEDRAPTARDKLEGLIFSILVAFDGGAGGMPAMDIVMRPHPEDKQFHIDEGEHWIEDGMFINDCQLHEMWVQMMGGDEEETNP